MFKNLAETKQFATDKMKKNMLFGTDRFVCDVYCFEPGQTQAPHTHDGQDKVYYVVEGRGLFQVGNEENRSRIPPRLLFHGSLPAGASSSFTRPWTASSRRPSTPRSSQNCMTLITASSTAGLSKLRSGW